MPKHTYVHTCYESCPSLMFMSNTDRVRIMTHWDFELYLFIKADT